MHKLIIQSLHDVQAKCSCDNWLMICTGQGTKEFVRAEFEKHLRHETNYRRRNKKS
jgi:hypothetical protein